MLQSFIRSFSVATQVPPRKFIGSPASNGTVKKEKSRLIAAFAAHRRHQSTWRRLICSYHYWFTWDYCWCYFRLHRMDLCPWYHHRRFSQSNDRPESHWRQLDPSREWQLHEMFKNTLQMHSNLSFKSSNQLIRGSLQSRFHWHSSWHRLHWYNQLMRPTHSKLHPASFKSASFHLPSVWLIPSASLTLYASTLVMDVMMRLNAKFNVEIFGKTMWLENSISALYHKWPVSLKNQMMVPTQSHPTTFLLLNSIHPSFRDAGTLPPDRMSYSTDSHVRYTSSRKPNLELSLGNWTGELKNRMENSSLEMPYNASHRIQTNQPICLCLLSRFQRCLGWVRWCGGVYPCCEITSRSPTTTPCCRCQGQYGLWQRLCHYRQLLPHNFSDRTHCFKRTVRWKGGITNRTTNPSHCHTCSGECTKWSQGTTIVCTERNWTSWSCLWGVDTKDQGIWTRSSPGCCGSCAGSVFSGREVNLLTANQNYFLVRRGYQNKRARKCLFLVSSQQRIKDNSVASIANSIKLQS